MVVVRRTKGGSYIVCEMNGAVLKEKVGKFRAAPFHQRYKITLSKKIEDLIDVSKERLDEMEDEESDDEEEYTGKDFQFHKVHLRPPGDEDGEDSMDEDQEEPQHEEELMGHWNEPEPLGPRRSRRKGSVKG